MQSNASDKNECCLKYVYWEAVRQVPQIRCTYTELCRVVLGFCKLMWIALIALIYGLEKVGWNR